LARVLAIDETNGQDGTMTLFILHDLNVFSIDIKYLSEKKPILKNASKFKLG
jgi:hypothetical protein